MSESAPDFSVLDDECIAYSHYLTGQKPSDYVLEKYREAHTAGSLIDGLETNYFDRFLLKISAKHPAMTKLVDAYTSLFFKRSTVRKKWILLLAILESCAPTHHYFDYPDSFSKRIFFTKVLGQGVVFLFALCLSVVLLMPSHLIFAGYAKLFGR